MKNEVAERDQVQRIDRNAEIVLAAEEVMRRNMEACIGHANETRKMFGLAEQRIDRLEQTMHAQQKLIEHYRNQLANLQQEFYRAGSSTSYAHPNKEE
jgi:uncharacterized coiled-coil protein SlyX